MVTVDSQPKSGGLVWGSTATWHCSAFIKWTEWTITMTVCSWWQCYKYCPRYYIIIIWHPFSIPVCPQLPIWVQQSHHHLPNHVAFEFFSFFCWFTSHSAFSNFMQFAFSFMDTWISVNKHVCCIVRQKSERGEESDNRVQKFNSDSLNMLWHLTHFLQCQHVLWLGLLKLDCDILDPVSWRWKC